MAKTPPKVAGRDTLSVPELIFAFLRRLRHQTCQGRDHDRTIEASIIKGLITRERAD
jgi:hypothetical protein